MRSSFYGLNLGYKGVAAQQRSLDVTGHNIANANTEGYSRQRAVMVTGKPMLSPNGFIGTGVDIINVERVRDKFLDQQFRNESNNKGYWDVTFDTYTKIEDILNEPIDGSLRQSMDDFWTGWQDLSKDPESAAIRTTVIQKGITAAENFNHLYNQLALLQEDIGYSIENKVSDINSLATRIADINLQVIRAESDGRMANDFRDKRDLLVEELSQIADLDITEDNRGGMNIFVGGQALVYTAAHNEIQAVPRADGQFDVKWANGSMFQAKNGELPALINSRDSVIERYIDQLDITAKAFAGMTNSIHQSGFGLSGADDTGNPFFTITGENIGANAKSLGDKTWGKTILPTITSESSAFDDVSFKFENAATSDLVWDAGSKTLTVSRDWANSNLSESELQDLINEKLTAATVDGGGGFTDTVSLDMEGISVKRITTIVNNLAPIITTQGNTDQLNGVRIQFTTDPLATEETASWDDTNKIITVSASDWSKSKLTESELQNLINEKLTASTDDGGAGLTEKIFLNMRGTTSDNIISATEFTLSGGQVPSEEFSSRNISVNSSIISDITKLAAATSPVTDPENGVGDGANALLLAQIKYDKTAINESTIDDSYRGMIGDIGINASQARSMANNQELLVSQISTQREYVMGVSLDEEMTQMIQFQQAYNSSARFLTTVDDMLDILVNRLGRVGL